MKIASLIRSIIFSGNERSLPDKGDLRVGDRLVGRVLELKGSGKAFVDFGRFRAMADVGFPVRQGEVIHVKVMDEGTPLRLGLCGPEVKVPEKANKTDIMSEFPSRHLLKEFQSQTRHLLPAGPDHDHRGKPGPLELNSAVRNLMAHFEPMDMGKDVSQISGQLKKFIEDAGIFYEKKLEKMMEPFVQGKSEVPARSLGEISEIRSIVDKDLKANLLVLKEFLDAKDPALKTLDMKDPERLRKTVEKFLEEITARQNDSGTRSRSEPVQVYTYLLPMKELETDAKIKVYYSRKKRSTPKEGFRVSLLLDMEKMGQIRTDFFLNGRSLTVDFSVTESPIKEYVDEHIDGLKTVLRDIFENVSVNVALSEKKISEFEFEDLTPLSTGLIDLKV